MDDFPSLMVGTHVVLCNSSVNLRAGEHQCMVTSWLLPDPEAFECSTWRQHFDDVH